jgi:hypothetical protein
MKQFLIILFSIIQLHAMGMYYHITANVETECKDYFPSGLSFFFEQIGGYGEKSMVSQVEQILDIDLSTFQTYDFMENEESDSTYWKDINEFELIIDLFLKKIELEPDYYKRVKYNPIVPVYGFSTDSAKMAEMKKTQEEYENSPMYGYPNDRGFLSEGIIIMELKELKSLLTCYRKAGATMIKLSYD